MSKRIQDRRIDWQNYIHGNHNNRHYENMTADYDKQNVRLMSERFRKRILRKIIKDRMPDRIADRISDMQNNKTEWQYRITQNDKQNNRRTDKMKVIRTTNRKS